MRPYVRCIKRKPSKLRAIVIRREGLRLIDLNTTARIKFQKHSAVVAPPYGKSFQTALL